MPFAVPQELQETVPKFINPHKYQNKYQEHSVNNIEYKNQVNTDTCKYGYFTQKFKDTEGNIAYSHECIIHSQCANTQLKQLSGTLRRQFHLVGLRRSKYSLKFPKCCKRRRR